MKLYGQHNAPAALVPEKEIRYAYNVRLRGLQSRSEPRRDRYFLPLSTIENGIVQIAVLLLYQLRSHTHTHTHTHMQIYICVCVCVCVCVHYTPISVAARFKAWVYGRPLAGIVGSNPTGGMDVSVVCCQVEVSATS